MDFLISRRDLLKMAGGAVAAFAAGPLCGSNGIPMKRVEAAASTDTVEYNGKQISLLCEADVCVVGGGCAGVAAAVNAARNGVSAVIIEQGISLGGSETLGLVNPMMPTFAAGTRTPTIQEIVDRLKGYGIDDCVVDKFGLSTSIGFTTEGIAQVYDDMCMESGVTVLYHTTLVDVDVAAGHIRHCIIQTVAGLMAVRARTYVDASGDAILSRMAGVPADKGNPANGGCNQPMSFRFEVSGIDVEKLYEYVSLELKDKFCRTKPPVYEIGYVYGNTKSGLNNFFVDAVNSGELTAEDCAHIQAITVDGKPGVMSFNCPELPKRLNSTNPMEYAQAVQIGRRMQRKLLHYFHNHMPGFEKAYISSAASIMGVRESWRVRGKLIMTGSDYYNQSRFIDAVARSAYYVDIHGGRSGEPLKKGEYYEVSFRTLITNEIQNLAVAGRCASADFQLNASMRIQPTCIATGEAAGIASAWALVHNMPVNAVKWEDIPADKRSYVSQG